MTKKTGYYFTGLLSFYLMGVILLSSCGKNTEPQATSEEITKAFLANYEPFCGKAFAGKSTFTDLGENHVLNDANLLMIFDFCTSDNVRIPFFVEDDRSRTWILSYTEAGLRLGHDHRYEDGTEHEANFYGGIAMENTGNYFEHYPENKTSSEYKLFFPADERTLADRPAREINVWSKEFDLENQRYYYRLYLYGDLRFEATFDLSVSVEDY